MRSSARSSDQDPLRTLFAPHSTDNMSAVSISRAGRMALVDSEGEALVGLDDEQVAKGSLFDHDPAVEQLSWESLSIPWRQARATKLIGPSAARISSFMLASCQATKAKP